MERNQILDAFIWEAFADGPLENDTLTEFRPMLVALGQLSRKDDAPLARACLELIARVDTAIAPEGSSDGVREALRALLELAGIDGEDHEGASDSAESDPENELLQMFLDSCGDALDHIEGLLLAVDEGSASADDVGELRRCIHTFKGECGVLSLHVPQGLCHEAETAIDRAQELGFDIPATLFLALVDWNRDYLTLIGDNANAEAPDHSKLLGDIEACCGGRQAAKETSEAPDAGIPDVPEPASEPEIDESEKIEYAASVFEDETLPEFLSEAQQHLEDAEAALLELEADPSEDECIHRIFRAFHTIKGVGGFLGLDPVCALAHSSETLLGKFRQADLLFTPEHGNLVLEAKDLMSRLLGALEGSEPPAVVVLKDLVGRLDYAATGGDVSALASAPKPAPVTPPAAPAADQQAPEAEPEPEPVSAEAEPAKENPVEAPAVTEAPASLPIKEVAPSKPAAKPASASAKSRQSDKKVTVDSTIKVNTQRLDALVDMVGELVIAQQMVMEDDLVVNRASERLRRNLQQLCKITRDLQESSMSLRMVTFKSTFQKMHRLVRDVSAKAGKQTRLELVGTDTEVDRNVVEKISDPLIHLIRNAIDHGLEGPDDRVALGKEAEGTIVLSAGHQGGAVVIQVTDNGRGLARDKILAKAVERGLINPNVDLDEMPDSAVFKLIFEPGFSTAAQITDISGRGVGMDVVRRNIESMRGKVEIQSTQGVGTTFTIQLPLTLAIIDAMLVQSGDQRFVIPTPSIIQSFQPNPAQVHALCSGNSLVEVRGTLVPVLRLDSLLSQGACGEATSDSTLIMVEAMDRRICLFVDDILGQQQVVIKSLGEGMPRIPVISGGAVLGDGNVALIIDVEGLMSEVESSSC